jgi:hypothetical protein
MNPTPPDDDPTPLWVIALVIFGLAGLGGPVAFLLIAWFF